MYTSYFSNLRNVAVPLSISGAAPDWYNGAQFRKLAPKYSFFQKYKDGVIDSADYTKEFQRLVLDPLDAREVYDRLTRMYGNDVTLLCYEKPGDFCHRRLVADWFERELNVEVPELGKVKPYGMDYGASIWTKE